MKHLENQAKKLYKYISNKYGFEPLFEMTNKPTEILTTITKSLQAAYEAGVKSNKGEAK